jgi:hypothetical protein
MYQMTANDARKRLIEIEREFLDLLRQFENDTGLTVEAVDIFTDQPLIGDPSRRQRRVRGLEIKTALT